VGRSGEIVSGLASRSRGKSLALKGRSRRRLSRLAVCVLAPDDDVSRPLFKPV